MNYIYVSYIEFMTIKHFLLKFSFKSLSLNHKKLVVHYNLKCEKAFSKFSL